MKYQCVGKKTIVANWAKAMFMSLSMAQYQARFLSWTSFTHLQNEVNWKTASITWRFTVLAFCSNIDNNVYRGPEDCCGFSSSVPCQQVMAIQIKLGNLRSLGAVKSWSTTLNKGGKGNSGELAGSSWMDLFSPYFKCHTLDQKGWIFNSFLKKTSYNECFYDISRKNPITCIPTLMNNWEERVRIKSYF